MWKALGACYALLQRDREAIKWYKRAAECDPDGKHRIMIQLARTYDKLGENNVAADYYRRALDRYVEENVIIFYIRKKKRRETGTENNNIYSRKQKKLQKQDYFLLDIIWKNQNGLKQKNMLQQHWIITFQ